MYLVGGYLEVTILLLVFHIGLDFGLASLPEPHGKCLNLHDCMTEFVEIGSKLYIRQAYKDYISKSSSSQSAE